MKYVTISDLSSKYIRWEQPWEKQPFPLLGVINYIFHT